MHLAFCADDRDANFSARKIYTSLRGRPTLLFARCILLFARTIEIPTSLCTEDRGTHSLCAKDCDIHFCCGISIYQCPCTEDRGTRCSFAEDRHTRCSLYGRPRFTPRYTLLFAWKPEVHSSLRAEYRDTRRSLRSTKNKMLSF